MLSSVFFWYLQMELLTSAEFLTKQQTDLQGRELNTQAGSYRTRGEVFKKGGIQVRCQEHIFCSQGGEAPAQVAWRSCVRGQFGWGSELPGLVEVVPVLGGEVGIR